MAAWLAIIVPTLIVLVGYIISIERRLAQIQRDIVWIKKELTKNTQQE